MKTLRTIIPAVFVLLLPCFAIAQTSTIDSLTKVLSKLTDKEKRIEVLSGLQKEYMSSDLEKSRSYGHQIVGLSKASGNKMALATAYKDLGVSFIIVSNFDSSMQYYQLAKKGYEQLMQRNGNVEKRNILKGYAGTMGNMGNWYYQQGQLDSSTICLHQALKLSEEAGALKVKANCLSTLSYIFMDQEQYERALEMQFEALHTFEKLGNQAGIARCYQGIGDINCNYLNKCKMSLSYFHKALSIKKSLGDARGIGYAYRKMGDVHAELNTLDSAEFCFLQTIEMAQKAGDKRLLIDGYSGLSNLAEQTRMTTSQRIEINQQIINVAKEINYVEALYVSYGNLGNLYAEQQEFEKSISYFEQAIPLATELKDYRSLAIDYYALYKIHKDHFRDSSKALEVLEQYLINHDSVSNSEKFRAVEDMSTKYETEKKEATIAEQELVLQQQRIRFWLITGILVLSLIGGVLLYRLTQQLRKRNEEKEFLIKEIHHRVKNNLQVLSSLLYLQSKHIKDDAALDAVREGQNRVDAMGLIHQKLYMGDNMAAVEMGDYLRNLGDTLLDSFGLEKGRIKINYHVEPLHLDVDTAIPLGLIINELVTNSLKYAFPDGRDGTLDISLWKNENGKLCLQVADDGVGKAGAPELKNSTSFGTNLVQILSKKLKGTPQVMDGDGYATVIEFGNFKEA